MGTKPQATIDLLTTCQEQDLLLPDLHRLWVTETTEKGGVGF